MDPKKVGRDSGEDKGKRFAAALELARKLKEQELKRLQKEGYSGEELKRRLGSTSELANYLYAVHPKDVDKYMAEKKRQLEELAGGKKKSSTGTDIPFKIAGALESGFRKLLQKKEESLEQSKKDPESGPKKEGEKKDTSSKKKSSEKESTARDDKQRAGKKERTDPKGFSEAVKKSRKLSEKKKEFSKEVQRLHFEEGLSQQEVADKLGVNVHTVYRLFKNEGLTPRASTKKIELDPREVKQLYESGLTQKEVAEQLGVSESTIYRRFKKHDIKPRRIGTRDEVDSKEVHRLHFEERLNRQEVAEKLGVSEQTISRIFRDNDWLANRVMRSRLDIDEIHRLYFDEKMTQKEVAKKIGVSTPTVSRVFKDQNWEARQINVDIDEIYRLYFIENLTKREVATKLDVRESTISHHFREQNWKARSRKIDDSKSKHLDVNIDELHRLYFDEKYNRSEVAKIMGIPPTVVTKIFKEKKWKYRDYKVHPTEEERELARKENRKNTQMKVVEMRERLFGTKCKICTEERKRAIHRKDGAEHNPDDLWKIKYLRTVNPDEYAAVCIPCHRGVHWMMNEYGQNWNQIKIQAVQNIQSEPKIRIPLELPDATVPSSQTYLEKKRGFEGSTEELRRYIFGDKCYFCDSHYDEGKRVIIHRKDGRSHDSKLTTQERYFRTLEPKEWVPLCQKHHRYVHWGMDDLGLEWDNLKESKIKEDGAEGEI